ncbi:MAG: ABC transporter substrate-binding protein [Acidimicrobiales bacterium]
MPARIQRVVGATTWLRAAVVLVVALVAGACAAPGDDAAEADTGVVPSRAAMVEDAVADDLVSGESPVPSGNGMPRPLRLAVVGEPATDPVAASPVDPADVAVLDLLYDGLTRWDDDAGTWVPAVAASVERDRNARVWTFVLGDRRFSDGTPIDADAVVAALERLRGQSALGADRLDHVASMRALDDATVRVRLTRPDAMFPALVSHPLFGITPTVDGGINLDGRVGSGPLHVFGEDANSLVKADVGTEALVEVEIVPVGDVDAGVAMVRSGDADVIHVPPSYAGPVDAAVPSGVMVAYALNAASPLLTSAEKRRALTGSISVADVAGALPGLEPIGGEGADPADAAAGGLLPDLLSLAIVGSRTVVDAESAMAATLATQWRDAGVDVALDELSLRAFVALVSAGDHDVIRSGWVELHPGDRPHWRLVEADSGANVTGVVDPDLASLVRRAGRDGTAEAQQAVDDAVAELGVLLPIGRLQVRVVTAPGVDFVSTRFDGSLVFGD